MQELWDDLKDISIHSLKSISKKNFKTAKSLLEFIIETPLEKLAISGELSNYLENVKSTLEKQANRLKTRFIAHVCYF